MILAHRKFSGPGFCTGFMVYNKQDQDFDV